VEQSEAITNSWAGKTCDITSLQFSAQQGSNPFSRSTINVVMTAS
jgi:hypothetical protein